MTFMINNGAYKEKNVNGYYFITHFVRPTSPNQSIYSAGRAAAVEPRDNELSPIIDISHP